MLSTYTYIYALVLLFIIFYYNLFTLSVLLSLRSAVTFNTVTGPVKFYDAYVSQSLFWAELKERNMKKHDQLIFLE